MPLKLVRRKGSDIWYLRGTVKGQAVFETTGTDNAEAAEAIRIKRESALLERAIFGTSAAVTFLEAAVSYLECGGEARFLGKMNEKTKKWSGLIGFFGETKLAEIDQESADRAAIYLFPKAGPATRKRMAYVPLCAVLNHAARKGWCARPMIQHPRVPKTQTKWSTPDRMEKLLPHCHPRERRLITLMAYTGMRLSEALRIDWDKDVDLPGRTIHIRKTKNGDMRAAFIPDPLLIELATVAPEDRRGLMFNYSDKTRVYTPLRQACKRAGVEYLPPHQQGRHTYATWMRSYAGLDLVGLKEAGGWKSIASVVRYAHVTPNEAARSAAKLPRVQNVQNPCSPDDEENKPLKINKK